ncbi:replicative DNA helicase loader DnaB [Mycoplasmopsis mustelae]|uniref:Replicative DNA helicase loader DnaB n=1 Tax=Mycoplasmopsis mustelae TaxID=171289 RepID=A0A4R7UE59_9BACT|nr:hypothetical protein [Mycoplasmopsis mustelae]TDV23274.1 replicative DNA helicase loader DnaB [Mycoplasmopsis mustelae]
MDTQNSLYKLDFNNFAISKNFNISQDDLHNLHQFYGTFLGPISVCLYEYLLDLSSGEKYKVIEYDFRTLALFLNVHEDELNLARTRLEGAGLLNTYKDNKRAFSIFEILRPQTPENIQKNPFLTDLIVSKIGRINFERFIKSRKSKISTTYYNSEYEDVTFDFFTVFPQTDKLEQKQRQKEILMTAGAASINKQEINHYTQKHNIAIPLIIGNVKYSNTYEAIYKLTPEMFFKQLNDSEINSVDEIMIKNWSDQIPDSKALNLIMYIARKKFRSEKWKKNVWTTIMEVISQNLYKFEDVEKYLDGLLRGSKKYVNIFEEKSILKNAFFNK